MRGETKEHWTRAWPPASALGLSAWTRDPRRLADPASARLVELLLELTALERNLVVHDWLVLPGAVHLLAATGPDARRDLRAEWCSALGRLKGLHARCDNRRRGATGSAWRPGLRLRPLDAAGARAAGRRLRQAPVRAGLCDQPAEWPHSSLRRRLDGPEAPWLVAPP